MLMELSNVLTVSRVKTVTELNTLTQTHIHIHIYTPHAKLGKSE